MKKRGYVVIMLAFIPLGSFYLLFRNLGIVTEFAIVFSAFPAALVIIGAEHIYKKIKEKEKCDA